MTMPARTITMVPLMATPRRAEGLAAQVWHLLRFDVLRMRWWLVAYGGLLMVGALHAVDLLLLSETQGMVAALAVPLLVMLSAVVLVQGDHPTAADAFWRGKPTDPRAQVIAKLLLLAAMISVSLLVVAIAVGVIGTPADTAVTLVGGAVPGMVMWTILALTIGAVTRDPRSAPLLFAGIGVLAVSTRMFGGLASFGPATLWVPEAWLVIAGAVTLLAALYHSAISVRPALAVTVVLGVLAIDSLSREMGGVREPNPSASAAMSELPASEAMERIVIDTVRFAGSEAGPMELHYHIANARPDARYAVQGARLTVHYADGTSVPLAMMDGGIVEEPRTATPLPAGSRWAQRSADSLHASGRMSVLVLYSWGKTQPTSKIRSIEVRGRLRRMLVRDTMSAPWQTGDVFRSRGQRLQLLDTTASSAEWQLRWSEPRGTGDLERDRFGESSTSLANTTLVRLDRNQLAHPIRPLHIAYTRNTQPIVLPWVVRRVETVGLSVDIEAEANGRPADVAGARLHVVRWATAAVVPVQAAYRLGTGGAPTP